MSEHLHKIGQVLLQISLRSGRSGLLVRGSLPSFSPLAVTHCQIPLPGFQISNLPFKFFPNFQLPIQVFSLFHHQVWLKWRNAHQEIRLQGSYQKKTKNSRERITPRANMVDVREDVGVGKDHVPEQHAEPTLPPHPPTSSTVESNSASLSVKEPACLPLSQAPPPNAPAQPDWKSRGVLVYPLPNSNSSSEATPSQAPGHPAPPVRIL